VSQRFGASVYRDSEVLSASPGRLVVITFDALLASMARARVGMALSKQEVTLQALDRSRMLLGELLGALNFERGGDIAAKLSGVYVFMLTELTTLGMRPNVATLDRLIVLIRELRGAFAQISHTPKAEVA
jgi:flagellar secretion chaperone FliS